MDKIKIVVVGGGWGGCAAAIAAVKAGAEAVLLERTDMLLGTGLVGGIYRNNGRQTAAEEMTALGGGGLAAAALLALWRYDSVAKKQFGGITGDLAGWFLQRAELWMLAALAVSQWGGVL